jgi:hypothetical protein
LIFYYLLVFVTFNRSGVVYVHAMKVWEEGGGGAEKEIHSILTSAIERNVVNFTPPAALPPVKKRWYPF